MRAACPHRGLVGRPVSALANYIDNVAATASNPYGAILAGACVLAAPAVALIIGFQRYFVSTNIGSGVKG